MLSHDRLQTPFQQLAFFFNAGCEVFRAPVMIKRGGSSYKCVVVAAESAVVFCRLPLC